eukprot:1161677-Pelagomonas_calceolata.AAC.15
MEVGIWVEVWIPRPLSQRMGMIATEELLADGLFNVQCMTCVYFGWQHCMQVKEPRINASIRYLHCEMFKFPCLHHCHCSPCYKKCGAHVRQFPCSPHTHACMYALLAVYRFRFGDPGALPVGAVPAVEGMKQGGRRSVLIPPEEGWVDDLVSALWNGEQYAEAELSAVRRQWRAGIMGTGAACMSTQLERVGWMVWLVSHVVWCMVCSGGHMVLILMIEDNQVLRTIKH